MKKRREKNKIMNKQDLIKGLGLLLLAYPNQFEKGLTNNTIDFWFSYFKAFNKTVFISALNNHINKSRFMPTISEIKEIIYMQNSLTGYSFDELWNQLLNGYHEAEPRYGGYDYSSGYDLFPKELKELVDYKLFSEIAKMDSFQRERTKENLRKIFLTKREKEKEKFLESDNPMELLPHWETKQRMLTCMEEK